MDASCEVVEDGEVKLESTLGYDLQRSLKILPGGDGYELGICSDSQGSKEVFGKDCTVQPKAIEAVVNVDTSDEELKLHEANGASKRSLEQVKNRYKN